MSDPETNRPTQKKGILRRLYNWTVGLSDKKHATTALAGISFIESSFFPIPPDILLLPLCLGNPKKALWKGLICTIASVLGAILGYYIGWLLWDTMHSWFIPHVFSQENFHKVGEHYKNNAFGAILAAAFTPIPFKVFTVAAGVYHDQVSLTTLVMASIVGRGARFMLIAGLVRIYGQKISILIEKYFNWFAWGVLVLAIVGFYALKHLS